MARGRPTARSTRSPRSGPTPRPTGATRSTLDGSFDANGDTPAEWVVNWGDDAIATYSGSNEFGSNNDLGGPLDATHTYTADGTFTVTATAVDATGSYSAQDGTYTISEPTPTFSVTGPDTFTDNQAYALTPSFSISSGDQPTGYVVSWGDGTDSTYDGSATAFSHTYTAGNGAPYTPVVTVTTDYGAYTASTSVDLAQPNVSISGPGSVTAGQAATFNTSFEDPNNHQPTTWTVYWGDGDEGETVAGNPGTLTHTYKAAPDGGGGWTVAAMATDVDGQFWADDATVDVTDPDASVSLTLPDTITAGVSFNATEGFDDPAGRTPYDWLVDWGDGSSYFYNGGNPQIGHDYMRPGSYQVVANAYAPPLDPAQTFNDVYSTTFQAQVTYTASFGFDLPAHGDGLQSDLTAHFQDPDGATPESYTISWGDDTSSEYGTSPDYGGIFPHTYWGAGEGTATAVVHTEDGDFTATRTVDLAPFWPAMAIDAGTYADSGQPYRVQAYFSDPAGGTTDTFPIPGAPVTYSINWGDGPPEVGSNPFAHAYSYNPTGNNDYVLTLAATATVATNPYTKTTYTTTMTATRDVVVQPSGEGQITIGDVPTAGEGAITTFAAGFSDSLQTEADGDVGADWGIAWGDGSPSDWGGPGHPQLSDFAPTHTYGAPGTYAVTFAAEYNEVGADHGITAHIVYSDPVNLTVLEYTPTLTLDSARTLSEGDIYYLSPTYTDTVGDHHFQSLTVDWGDQTTSIYEGNFPLVATHVYTTAGGYAPSASVQALNDDGSITASVPGIDVEPPTIWIAAQGDATADEAGQGSAAFVVTRTGNDVACPLTYFYQEGGSLAGDFHNGEGAYIPTEADGRVIDSGEPIVIPAGQHAQTLLITALEDHTPRWTETADYTLDAAPGGSDYSLAPTWSVAGCYVTNDDLYAWLDNGSDNDVLMGDGGDYTQGTSLVPLVLDLPAEQRDGAVVTLVANAPTEANVWMNGGPGGGGQPILGNVNGTYVSSYTWTYGPGSNAPIGEATLQVEPTDGSASINDISFEVYDSDAGCGQPGTGSDPQLPQPVYGDETYATTSVSDPSNGATAIKLAIIEKNDPNGGRHQGVDVSSAPNNTQFWLVGQMVDLEAEVEGPSGFAVPFYSYSWASPPGNVARAWTVRSGGPTGGTATTVPLSDDDGGAISGAKTGLMDQELAFFWVTRGSGTNHDTYTVSVTASGEGQQLQASTTFELWAPTISNDSSIDLGIPSVSSNQVYMGQFSGVRFKGSQVGMLAQVKVTTPAMFGQGTVNILQLDQLTATNTSPVGPQKTWYPPTVPGLDGSWPLSQKNVDPFSPGAGWATGDVMHYYIDQPMWTVAGYTSYTSNESFTDYVMYLPPGPWSQWVPLATGTWGYHLGATRKTIYRDWVWLPKGGTPGQFGDGQFHPPTNEPTWNFVVNPNTQWVKG
jgi:hypothetical protein